MFNSPFTSDRRDVRDAANGRAQRPAGGPLIPSPSGRHPPTSPPAPTRSAFWPAVAGGATAPSGLGAVLRGRLGPLGRQFELHTPARSRAFTRSPPCVWAVASAVSRFRDDCCRARGAGWPELRACVRMRLLPHVCVRVCTAPCHTSCHTSCVAACFWVRGGSPASWRQTGFWVRGGVGDLASHDRGAAWDWPMRSQEVSPRGSEISSLACRAGLCYSGDRVGSDSCARAAPVSVSWCGTRARCARGRVLRFAVRQA